MSRFRSVNRAPFKYGLSTTHAHLSAIVRRPTVSDIRVFLKIGCVCSIFPQSLNQQGNSYFFNFSWQILLAVVVRCSPNFCQNCHQSRFQKNNGSHGPRKNQLPTSHQKTVDSNPRCHHKSDIDFAN